jgi:hypothetical protein
LGKGGDFPCIWAETLTQSPGLTFGLCPLSIGWGLVESKEQDLERSLSVTVVKVLC